MTVSQCFPKNNLLYIICILLKYKYIDITKNRREFGFTLHIKSVPSKSCLNSFTQIKNCDRDWSQTETKYDYGNKECRNKGNIHVTQSLCAGYMTRGWIVLGENGMYKCEQRGKGCRLERHGYHPSSQAPMAESLFLHHLQWKRESAGQAEFCISMGNSLFFYKDTRPPLNKAHIGLHSHFLIFHTTLA